MITADGKGYAPDPPDDEPYDPQGEPVGGPDYRPPAVRTAPPGFTPPAPRGPVWSGPNAQDRDYFDGPHEPDEDEPETDRERILREDKSARLERMIWRNAFLGLYTLALIMYAGWALTRDGIAWNLSAFVALIVGAGGVGLFLVSREQGEREIEYERSKPETRSTTELPGLRRPAGMGAYSDEPYDR
jgi:hypothetical protein